MGSITQGSNMKTAAILTLLVSLVPGLLAYLEEAPYNVTTDHEGWQERSYPPTRWVSTNRSDVYPHDGDQHSGAFYDLFNYIDGGNSANQKIPMTAPVTLRIEPGEGPNCESFYTMSFLIPSDLQEGTPEPTNSLVYLEDRQEMKVVTKTFGGFPTDLDFSMQAAELYDLAVKEGLEPSSVPLWTAGYSGPGVIVNRRSEVWLQI